MVKGHSFAQLWAPHGVLWSFLRLGRPKDQAFALDATSGLQCLLFLAHVYLLAKPNVYLYGTAFDEITP
jgi:hypothetical protein